MQPITDALLQRNLGLGCCAFALITCGAWNEPFPQKKLMIFRWQLLSIKKKKRNPTTINESRWDPKILFK